MKNSLLFSSSLLLILFNPFFPLFGSTVVATKKNKKPPPSVPYMTLEDGSYFHELHRMNPAERKLHRAGLKSFLDHPSFHFPQIVNQEEGYSEHDFHLEDEFGRKCILKYTIEHSELHIFRSLDDSDVVKVSESANGETMTVFFSSEELAAGYFANYTSVFALEEEEGSSKLLMLTGSAKWGLRRSHKGVEGQGHPILVEVSKLHPFVAGETSFTMDVQHVPIQRALKNADIHMELKLHHEDYDFYRIRKTSTRNPQSEDGDDEEANRGRRLDFLSWLMDRFTDVANMVETVITATVNVAQAAMDIASGNFDAENTPASITFVDYNYNPSTKSAVAVLDLVEELGIDSANSEVTCTECYAYAATTLHLNMKITSYKMQTVEIYISGDASFKMEMDGTLSDVTKGWEKEVFAWASPTVLFSIGPIPMSVSIETPVFMSLDVSLTSTVTFSSSLYAQLAMKAGYRYSIYSSPALQQISQNSVVYGGSGLKVNSLCDDATASIRFGITPMAQFVLAFIGGPNVAVKGYVEAIASVPNQNLVINAGFEGTIGGKIEVELKGFGTLLGPYKFGPVAVVKASKNLMTYSGWYPGCATTACPNTCYGYTCDYWDGNTCSELESIYSCDCSGCSCANDGQPTVSPTIGCPATCYDYTCDHWNANTCSELESIYGCDCGGCSCANDGQPTVSPTIGCPATCQDQTCDHWNAYTCSELESIYGCDCGGCSCVNDDDTTFTSSMHASTSDRRLSSTSSWDMIGQTWFGNQTTLQQSQTCSKYPQSSQLSVQLLASDFVTENGRPSWGLFVLMSQYIGVNEFDAGAQGAYAGLSQYAYKISYDNTGSANIRKCIPSLCDDNLPGWQSINYTDSTSSSSGLTPIFPSLYGIFHGESMTFSDTLGCLEVNLYNTASLQMVMTLAPTVVPPTAGSLSPTKAPTACPASCYGYTCDYWDGNTCSELESIYECDCGGCSCANDGDSQPTGPPTACPATCDGYTCDYWNGNSCSELENIYGCDCGGCDCVNECPATCYGQTCDYWDGNTCSELESSYGCDCGGCSCFNDDQPTVSPTIGCPATCQDQTCDYWNGNTCSDLESIYGCECGGCNCVNDCPATCDGYTCDYWNGNTCNELENVYGCDCSGCKCANDGQPTVSPTISCPATCDGHTCEYWNQHNYTCSELESRYGCDCGGCSCANECSATCDGYTCDYWSGNTCSELESIYGCDCGGCSCANDVDSQPTGSPTACPASCYGYTCDYWDGNTCSELESTYGCDCEGCSCINDDLSTLSMSYTYAYTTSCPATCYYNETAYTCDDFSNTCSDLENIYGCDCGGCSCVNDANSTVSDTTACPATCYGNTCDYWDAYTCSELQDSYGCNCSGCVCSNDVAFQPTGSPTAVGGSIPSVPIQALSAFPTLLPSSLPTAEPSSTVSPSSMPSMLPSTIDTTSIDVSFDLSADADPTDAEKESLKETLAGQIGVTDDSIKDFFVNSVSNRRRTLLSAYTWQCSFKVETSLAAVGVSSAPLLADKITTTLQSSDFQTAVSLDILSAVVVTSSITSTPISPTAYPTKHPSPFPSVSPSLIPAKVPTSGSSQAMAASTTYIIVGLSVVAVLIVFGGLCLCRRRNFYEQFVENGVESSTKGKESDLEMIHVTSESLKILTEDGNDSELKPARVEKQEKSSKAIMGTDI